MLIVYTSITYDFRQEKNKETSIRYDKIIINGIQIYETIKDLT